MWIEWHRHTHSHTSLGIFLKEGREGEGRRHGTALEGFKRPRSFQVLKQRSSPWGEAKAKICLDLICDWLKESLSVCYVYNKNDPPSWQKGWSDCRCSVQFEKNRLQLKWWLLSIIIEPFSCATFCMMNDEETCYLHILRIIKASSSLTCYRDFSSLTAV